MGPSALAVLALLAGAGPKVELGPLAKTAMLRMGKCDVEVTFRLVVQDGASEDYYCPRIEWLWEDGSTAVEESDCPPFSEATADDHRRTWMRARTFQNSGRYLVKVRLAKADRVVHTVETIAVVEGWSGYSPDRRQEFGCSPARPGTISQPGSPGDPLALPTIHPPPMPAFPTPPP
jgi:hypothetical protein